MLSFTPTNLGSTRFNPDETQWPPGSRRRYLFGQVLLFRSVTEGGRHLDEDTLESVYRHQGDAVLDTVLELLQEEGRPIGHAEDLLALAATAMASSSTKTSSKADRALALFYQHCCTIPAWVDGAAVQRGQNIFLANTPAIGASLFYRSLVPGFSLPKIAAVLLSTGYLVPPASEPQVQKRLRDTGAFLAAVALASPAQPSNPADDLCQPESPGWNLALHVRVLHAKVRHALLRRRQGGTRQWKTNEFGVPINQEDLAATLLAFSYNTMLGCEMILGRPWCVQERLDFLHFWRYIGWLLGIHCVNDESTIPKTFPNTGTNEEDEAEWPPLDPCGPGWFPDEPDPLAHSNAMFGSILLHLSKPNATSVQIAHHLLRMGYAPKQNIDHTQGSAESKSKEAWFYFRAYQCRRFVGNELADALLLPYHPIWYKRLQLRILSNCYLWFLRCYTWAALPCSPFRTTIVNFHRRNFVTFLTKWQQPQPPHGVSFPATTATDDCKQESTVIFSSTTSCPFAMVAPPQY